MYISPDRQRAILTPPRTASRAVRDFLMQRYSWAQFGHHNITRDGTIEPEAVEQLEGIPTVVCLVRNHWDTLTSWWLGLPSSEKKKVPGFDAWVQLLVDGKSTLNRWVEPGRLWGKWLDHATRVVQGADLQPLTVRYERLEGELAWVVKMETKDIRQQLQHVGVSPGRDGRRYSAFYSDRSRDLVGEYFGPEILRLGYNFREVRTCSLNAG